MKARNIVVIVLVVSIVLQASFVLATDSTSSNPTDTTEWPMFMRTLNHTSYYPATVNKYGITQLWNYSTALVGSGAGIINSPAVANGMVYFGTHGDNITYALNATTGAHIWNYTGTNNNQISSAAAVVGNVVYMGSAAQRVYAINATNGLSIWNFTTGANIDYSSAAVSNNILYIGDISNKLYAINTTNGNQLWTYTTGNRVDSSPAVVSGIVYVGSDDFKIYALNASNGSLIWNYTTGGAVRSSPTISNNILYTTSLDNKTYALNASTGQHIWNYTTEAYRNNTPDTDILTSTPTVANNIVYIATSNQITYALNATTGSHIWNYTTVNTTASSIITDNVLIVPAGSTIYVLNASTGAHIINYTGSGSYKSAAIANGLIYVGDGGGIMYAFNLTADTTPPVRSAGSPSGTITTSSTTLSVTTDENATCKYDTSTGVAYSSMANSFSDSGTSHTASISGLTNGDYNYYVRCQDTSSNANTNDYTISFTVSLPAGQGAATCTASIGTDCATVDVSISSETIIDISPNSFNWPNVQVGTIAPSALNAVIENIGSSNISKVSIDVQGGFGAGFNPYASGRVDNIAAGSYLLAATDQSTFAYLQNALPTNEISPVYMTLPINVGAKGRFRFASHEYPWSVTTGNVTGGGATATCGNGTLKYFNTTVNVHNRTQQGGTDLTLQQGITLQLNAPANDPTSRTDAWGFADISFNMPSLDQSSHTFNTSYCFAIRQDCQVARLWKWNNNQGLGSSGTDAYDNASLCTKDTYVINDTTNGGVFKPGQMQTISLIMAIPQGTANGSFMQSILTIRATD